MPFGLGGFQEFNASSPHSNSSGPVILGGSGAKSLKHHAGIHAVSAGLPLQSGLLQRLGCTDIEDAQDVDSPHALNRAVSDMRRSKSPAVGGSRLPGVRTVSGHIAGRTASGRSAFQQGSQDSIGPHEPAIMKRSEKAVRTWSKMNDNSLLQYKMPMSLSSASTSASSYKSRQSQQQIEDSLTDIPSSKCDPLPLVNGAHHRYAISVPTDQSSIAGRLRDDNAPLPLSEVVNHLADTNMTSICARDAIQKLKVAIARDAHGNQPDDNMGTGFTKRYFSTCHVYGLMVDFVQQLAHEVADLDDGAAEGKSQDGRQIRNFTQDVKDKFMEEKQVCERLELVRTLKEVLGVLGSFNWDYLISDFRMWVHTTTIGDIGTREMIEQIADQESETLSKLSLSRYLIEDSLATHLVTAARSLTNFHNAMTFHISEVDQRHVLKGNARRDSKLASQVKARIQQLGEERDKHMRQIESNRNLAHHLKAAQDKATDSPTARQNTIRNSMKKRQSAIVIHAGDPDDPTPAKASREWAAEMKRRSMKEDLTTQHQHIENTFVRMLGAARCHVDATVSYNFENKALREKMEHLMRRQRRQKDNPHRKLSHSLMSSALNSPSLSCLSSPQHSRRPSLSCPRNRADSNLSHLLRVRNRSRADSASSSAVCSGGSSADLWGGTLQEEIEWLEQNRKRLGDDLNNMTVQVSLRDFLTQEERSDNAPLPDFTIQSRHPVHGSETKQPFQSLQELLGEPNPQIKLPDAGDDASQKQASAHLCLSLLVEAPKQLGTQGNTLDLSRLVEASKQLGKQGNTLDSPKLSRRIGFNSSSGEHDVQLLLSRPASKEQPAKCATDTESRQGSKQSIGNAEKKQLSKVDREEQTQLIKKCGRANAKLKMLLSSNAALKDKVNGSFGVDTWQFCPRSVEVWFMQHPTHWILETLQEAAQEFVDMSTKDEGVKAGLIDLQEELEDKASAFQADSLDRQLCYADKKEFVQRSSAELNMEDLIFNFSTWYKKYRAHSDAKPWMHNEKYVNTHHFSNETIEQQEKKFDKDQVRHAKLLCKLEELRAQSEESNGKLEIAMQRQERIAIWQKWVSRVRQKEVELGKLIQNILTISNERKMLQVGSMRGGSEGPAFSSKSEMTNKIKLARSKNRIDMTGLLRSEIRRKKAKADGKPASHMAIVSEVIELSDVDGIDISMFGSFGEEILAKLQNGDIVDLSQIERESEKEKHRGAMDLRLFSRTLMQRNSTLSLKSLSSEYEPTDDFNAVDASLMDLPEAELHELFDVAFGSPTDKPVFQPTFNAGLLQREAICDAIFEATSSEHSKTKKKKSLQQVTMNADGTRFSNESRTSTKSSKRLKRAVADMDQRGKVLEMRRKRLHKDYLRVCDRATGRRANIGAELPDQMKVKWAKELKELRYQNQGCNKMLAFWNSRFASLHNDVSQRYSEDASDEQRQPRSGSKEFKPFGEENEQPHMDRIAGRKKSTRFSGPSGHFGSNVHAESSDLWEAQKSSKLANCFSAAFHDLGENEQKIKHDHDIQRSGSKPLGGVKGAGVVTIGGPLREQKKFASTGRKTLDVMLDRLMGQALKGEAPQKSRAKNGSNADHIDPGGFMFSAVKGKGKGKGKGGPNDKAALREQVMKYGQKSQFAGFAFSGVEVGAGLTEALTYSNPAVMAGRVKAGRVLSKRSLHSMKTQSLELDNSASPFFDVMERRKSKGGRLRSRRESQKVEDTKEEKKEKYIEKLKEDDMMMSSQFSTDWNSSRDRLQSLKRSRERRQRQSQHSGTAHGGFMKMFLEDSFFDGPKDEEEELERDMLATGKVPSCESKKEMAMRKSRNAGAKNKAKDQEESDGSGGLSASSDEGKEFLAKRHGGPHHQDDKIWLDMSDQQKAIRALRACRDKLVQRFGGVDKVYLKCTSPVVGMNGKVFAGIAVSMGFSEAEADLMWSLLRTLARTSKKQTTQESGARKTLVKQGTGGSLGIGRTDVDSLPRADFAAAMRSIAPVRNLLQLRARLKRKYPDLDHAFLSLTGGDSFGLAGALVFRDALAGLGVSAWEARTLMRQMVENNGLPSESNSSLLIDRHGFLASLTHAESLVAAQKLHTQLHKLVNKNPEAYLQGSRKTSKEKYGSNESNPVSEPTTEAFLSRKSVKAQDCFHIGTIKAAAPTKAPDVVISAHKAPDAILSALADVLPEELASECTTGCHPSPLMSACEDNSSATTDCSRQPSLVLEKASQKTRFLSFQSSEDEEKRAHSKDSRSSRGSIRTVSKSNSSDDGPDWDRAMYNAFVFNLEGIALHEIKKPITGKDMRVALKAFALAPDDVYLLFRLSAGVRDTTVLLQDVIMRVLGGFGHKHDEMRLKFGLKPLEDKNAQQQHRRSSKQGTDLSIGTDGKTPTATNRIIRGRGSSRATIKQVAPEGLDELSVGARASGATAMGTDAPGKAMAGSLVRKKTFMRLNRKTAQQFNQTTQQGGSRSQSFKSQGSGGLSEGAAQDELLTDAASGAEAASEDNVETEVTHRPHTPRSKADKRASRASRVSQRSGQSLGSAREGSNKSEFWSHTSGSASTSGSGSDASSNEMQRQARRHTIVEPGAEQFVSLDLKTGKMLEKKAGEKDKSPERRASWGRRASDGPPTHGEGGDMGPLRIGGGEEEQGLSPTTCGRRKSNISQRAAAKSLSKSKSSDQQGEFDPVTDAVFGTLPGQGRDSKAPANSKARPAIVKRQNTDDVQNRGEKKSSTPSASGDGRQRLTTGSRQNSNLSMASQDGSPGRQRLTQSNRQLSTLSVGKRQSDETSRFSMLFGAVDDGRQDSDTLSPRADSSSAESWASSFDYDGPPQDLEAETVQLKALEEAEIEKHLRRLALFMGNATELEIATRKLQECRARIISRFKSLPKAFDDLSGGRGATTTLKALQEKLVRLLKFNSLDAERVVAVMATIEDPANIGFGQFLHIFHFAVPVTTMLGFRARLVQRYRTIDAAFRVFNFDERRELSVDMFEKPMLGAGIVSADSLRLFKFMDKVQLNGPTGFLKVDSIRFIVDHAHVFGWLEIFNARFAGRGGVHAAFDKMPGNALEAIASPADLEAHLANVGFPPAWVPALFKFLDQRSAGQVTLASILQIISKTCDEREGRCIPVSTVAEPVEFERDRGLVLTSELRLYIMREFPSYQHAYDAFELHDPTKGITLSEWESAESLRSTLLGSLNAHSWSLIFGHIIDWQHARWDPKLRSTDSRITPEKFAEALNTAAPCRTLTDLRSRLMDKWSLLPQAWAQLAGKETAEEVGFVPWQRALRNIGIGLGDAGQLFALLQAVPRTSHTNDTHHMLSRSVFLHGLKGDRAIEVYGQFRDLMLLLTSRHGVISAAFEGKYEDEPLPLSSFEDTVGCLLRINRQAVKPLFAHLDLQKEGLVAVNSLMDTLTQMQASYLPHVEPPYREEQQKLQILTQFPASRLATGSTTVPGDETPSETSPINRPGTAGNSRWGFTKTVQRALASLDGTNVQPEDIRPNTSPNESTSSRLTARAGPLGLMKLFAKDARPNSSPNEAASNSVRQKSPVGPLAAAVAQLAAPAGAVALLSAGPLGSVISAEIGDVSPSSSTVPGIISRASTFAQRSAAAQQGPATAQQRASLPQQQPASPASPRSATTPRGAGFHGALRQTVGDTVKQPPGWANTDAPPGWGAAGVGGTALSGNQHRISVAAAASRKSAKVPLPLPASRVLAGQPEAGPSCQEESLSVGSAIGANISASKWSEVSGAVQSARRASQGPKDLPPLSSTMEGASLPSSGSQQAARPSSQRASIAVAAGAVRAKPQLQLQPIVSSSGTGK